MTSIAFVKQTWGDVAWENQDCYPTKSVLLLGCWVSEYSDTIWYDRGLWNFANVNRPFGVYISKWTMFVIYNCISKQILQILRHRQRMSAEPTKRNVVRCGEPMASNWNRFPPWSSFVPVDLPVAESFLLTTCTYLTVEISTSYGSWEEQRA